MSREDVESVVRDGLAAFLRGDYERALEFVAPDVVIECRVGLVGLDGVYEGHEELARWLMKWWRMFESRDTEIVELRTSGSDAILCTTHRGVGKASGAPAEFTHWQLCRVRDGQVRRWWQFRTEAETLAAHRGAGERATRRSPGSPPTAAREPSPDR
jgi:ketosteroid isomerase-like protein